MCSSDLCTASSPARETNAASLHYPRQLFDLISQLQTVDSGGGRVLQSPCSYLADQYSGRLLNLCPEQTDHMVDDYQVFRRRNHAHHYR